MQHLLSQESIGLLIGASRRRIKQVVWHHLRPYGITPQQLGILLALWEHPNVSLHEVAERLWLDDPTTGRVTRRLMGRGLVEAGDDPQDRRRFHLRLTPTGRALTRQLRPLGGHIRELIEELLSPREQAVLRRGLHKIIQGFEERSCAGSCGFKGPGTRRRSR